MNLSINKYEIKKVFTSPIVIILMAIFIGYNWFIIYQNQNYSDYSLYDSTRYTNQIIKEYGYKLTEDNINKLQSLYDDNLSKLNKMTKEKFDKTYVSIGEFLESDEWYHKYYDNEIYIDEDREFVNELSILSNYSNPNDLIKSYESLDMNNIGDNIIEMYGISGDAKEIVKDNYEKLDKRFEELIDNKEHTNIYFLDGMHSFMYRDIFQKCIFEIIILIVLVTSFLVNYEFDNKTSLLVYSTKRGRNNYKDKLLTSIISSLIIGGIILISTYGVYFMVFDYSEIFSVPLSNIYNWEYKVPNIGWFDVTVLEHFIMSIVLTLISTMIFTLITFVISKLIKNSYITFFIFFILFGMVLIGQGIFKSDNPMMIYSNFNIFQMISNPHKWFMECGYTTHKYYEVISISISGVIAIILSIFTIKRFKKEDLA